MTLKQQFSLKSNNKYQILDKSGNVLGEYKFESTAINMVKQFRLNKKDKLEVRKV